MVQELYYRGNEIAVESVTGRNLMHENLTIWREEIETMRDLLGKLANVPAKDILGVRAPSLKPGFNDQYQVCYFSTMNSTLYDSNDAFYVIFVIFCPFLRFWCNCFRLARISCQFFCNFRQVFYHFFVSFSFFLVICYPL